MIKIDRNYAFSGLNLTQRELKYSIFANWGKIVYPGKCVALGECYAKNAVKDFG